MSKQTHHLFLFGRLVDSYIPDFVEISPLPLGNRVNIKLSWSLFYGKTARFLGHS